MATHVVRNGLTTKVEQCPREVAMRKLERMVDAPERRRERVRDTREATARGRVRLEQEERLAPLLRERCRVQVRLGEVDASLVREVLREHFQRVAGRVVRVGPDDSAVVARVAAEKAALGQDKGACAWTHGATYCSTAMLLLMHVTAMK